MDEINALPYLDCVIRETFRVHPPVPSTVREAVEDDIVPLALPFTDKKGRIIHELTCVAEYIAEGTSNCGH